MRNSLIRRAVLPGVVTIGVLGTLSYMYATRTADVGQDPAGQSLQPSENARVTSDLRSDSSPANERAAGVAQVGTSPESIPESATDVARLSVDTRSPDPQTRATAIAALAQAPRMQAVPVLKQVIETGEPGTDRQIALQSLHTLALAQGDQDERIRTVLRSAIYHGDDEEASQSAQALLEDIENEFALRLSKGE